MNSLKNVIRTHTEWLLSAAGILLIIIIGWILVWGVTVLAQDLSASLGASGPQNATDKFDLEAASKLNFRGLQ